MHGLLPYLSALPFCLPACCLEFLPSRLTALLLCRNHLTLPVATFVIVRSARRGASGLSSLRATDSWPETMHVSFRVGLFGISTVGGRNVALIPAFHPSVLELLPSCLAAFLPCKDH